MFLNAIERKIEADTAVFPWSLPVFRWLDRLEFHAPVTLLVGENGAGKSTLLEGLAAGMDAVVAGGVDIERDESLAAARRFAAGYRFSRKHKPRARLFVRAEDLFELPTAALGECDTSGPNGGRLCAPSVTSRCAGRATSPASLRLRGRIRVHQLRSSPVKRGRGTAAAKQTWWRGRKVAKSQ